ncbi:MAG: Nif11 family protein [Synergistaceae bacterium]|nr:Nif11 family protein [Synergistaceae bacterium]
MSDIKKFYELVSKDESLRKELEAAIKKSACEAAAKVAAAHGFKLGGMEELDMDELSAVAGGISYVGSGKDKGDVLSTGQLKGASFTC